MTVTSNWPISLNVQTKENGRRVIKVNYAITIATLGDWFKNLAPVYRSKLHVNSYEFGLVHCAVCTRCHWSK